MKTSFDIQRFSKLFINEWVVNKKRIALYWGGLFGIPVLYFILIASMGDVADTMGTFVFLYILILLFQALFISMHYSDFTSKTGTQALLLLPASRTETYLAKFVSSLIVFPLLALIYFSIMMHVTAMFNSWAHVAFNKPLPSSDWWSAISGDNMLFLSLLCIWFFDSAVFLWGALTFRKWVIVKSYLSWQVIFILLYPVTGCLYALVSGHFPSSYFPFLFIGESSSSRIQYAFSLVDQYPYFIHWVGLYIGIFLMVIARIKYNEKTI